MESINKKTRILWIDVMRGFMMFCIVLGHSIISDENPLKTYVNAFHVAAFVFISGFLFSTGGKSFLSFLWSKFKSLMIPYYAFSVISILIFSVGGQLASKTLNIPIESVDITDNLLEMIYASGAKGGLKWNLPLWFLPSLFVLVVVFFFLDKLIKILVKKIGIHFTCSALFLISLVFNYLNYYLFNIKHLPMGAEAALYLAPFFIAGYWLKNSSFDLSSLKKSRRWILGLSLIAVALIPVFVNNSVPFPVYVTSGYGNLSLFYSGAILSTAGYAFISTCIEVNIFEYVGKRTLWVLLMHKFPILALQMFFVEIMSRSGIINIAISIPIAIISFILCLIVGELVDRVFPFLFGKWYKSKSKA